MNIQLKNDTRRALAVPATMSACVTSLAKVAMVMMIAFSPMLAAAQADSSRIMFRISGEAAALSDNNREWGVNFSVGAPVGKHWEIGFGFDYQKQKTITENAYWDIETNEHLAVGRPYVAGRWKLLKGLYFHPVFYAGIGEVKRIRTNQDDVSVPFFGYRLAPAFSYYFSRYFALNLDLGGFQFIALDWKWANRQWEANVNPTYWTLGIILAFNHRK